MAISKLHTLGDSTLDNLFWTLEDCNFNVKNAKQDSVEGILQEHLKVDQYEVVSHAYDGFTTTSVLKGDQIGAVLPNGRAKALYMREKAFQSRFAYPLTELQQKVSETPDAPHYVVMSVGGNDFRENLLKPWHLLKDIPQIQKRYLQILEKIKGLEGKNIQPILMLQYRTDANDDPYWIYPVFRAIGSVAVIVHLTCLALLTAPIWILAGKISALVGGLAFLSGAIGLYLSRKIVPLSVTKDVFLGKSLSMATLAALMQSFYQPILEYAKKERIPILDLPNTFNPYHKLYDCGIEPNKEGGKLIAEGIYHILKHHDFAGESALYSKSGQSPTYTRAANTNPSSWQVTYQNDSAALK
jgi:hypothetical protein